MKQNLIGDRQGIEKTLSLLKATAGFCMVYLHGMTMFSLALQGIDFKTEHWVLLVFDLVKVSLAGCLPAFAGYYVRGEVGPFIRNHRLPLKFVWLGLRFFLVAAFLEALRLYGSTFDLTYIFNWNALHFIGIAMILTYLLLALDDRLLIFFVLMLIIGNDWLARLFSGLQIEPADFSDSIALIASWCWAISFAAMIYWGLWKTRIWFKNPPTVRTYLIPVVFASLGALVWGQGFIFQHPRGLISFVNLPHSVLFTNDFDDNYWGLVASYSTFAFGYFLRGFLFNINYRKFFPIVTGLMITRAVYFFTFHYNLIVAALGNRTTYTKASFFAASSLVDRLVNIYLALFYLVFIVLYYLFSHRKTIFLDKFSYASRSILILYLVHGVVLHIFLWAFPVQLVERWKSGQIFWCVEIVLIFAYAISLLLSDRIAFFFERSRLVKQTF